jgi:uncharacterized protein (TIGR02217 family)
VGPLDQQIGVGDGSTRVFQLIKVYSSGGQSYTRTISKPVAGTARVAINGVVQTAPTQFTVDIATGLVSFNLPPTAGLIITAGCEFDVPVRFDTDRISTSMATFQAGQIPSVPVIEVRL